MQQSKLYNEIKKILSILFLLIFIPILISVIFIGNKANYPEYYKLNTKVDNWVIFLASLLLAIVIFFIVSAINRIGATSRGRVVFNIFLALLFVGVTLINIKLCKSLAFLTGWADPLNAQYSGHRMLEGISIDEGTWYYGLCPNNIPIAYICALIFKLLNLFPNFIYGADFFVIEVNCWIISVSGFFICLCTQKLSEKYGMTVMAAFAYIALFCVSPWKLFFYTDTAGMFLPIVTLYLYLCYRKCSSNIKKLLWIMLCITGMLSGMIKPTAYTCLIAISLVEICRCFFLEKKKILGFLIIFGGLILSFILVNLALKDYIYDYAKYTPNEDLVGTWTYYLNMGSNEEYMGTNNPVDSGLLIGEYSGRPGSERREAEINSFLSRTKERGLWGNISFWNRKLTMTFNDGTFSWFREGNALFYTGEYADISANPYKELLRNIFWGDGEYYSYYETYAQWIWIFVLLGLTGVAFNLFEKSENDNTEILVTLVIGIGVILFQMLFETRARYLICSLPLLIVMATMGYNWYFEKISRISLFNK